MTKREPKPKSWVELLKHVVTAAATWIITHYTTK